MTRITIVALVALALVAGTARAAQAASPPTGVRAWLVADGFKLGRQKGDVYEATRGTLARGDARVRVAIGTDDAIKATLAVGLYSNDLKMRAQIERDVSRKWGVRAKLVGPLKSWGRYLLLTFRVTR